MTRRRLWVVTTACCAVLALPTVARFIGLVMPAGVTWATALVATRRVSTSTMEHLQAIGAWTTHTMTTAFTAGGAPSAQRLPMTVAPAPATHSAAAQTTSLSHTTSDLLDRWHASAQTTFVLVALILALMALAVLAADRFRQRRRAAAPERARRLAERGAAIGVIARRTGLPQDAVRQLIHTGANAPEKVEEQKVESRHQPQTTTTQRESDRAAFADLLAATLDPKEGLLGAFTPRRGHAQAVPLPNGKGEACLAPTTIIPGSRSNR